MIKKIYIFFGLILIVLKTFGQSPTHYPPIETDPVEFNAVRIILYIVLPVALLILFVVLRRRNIKKRKELRKRWEKEGRTG